MKQPDLSKRAKNVRNYHVAGRDAGMLARRTEGDDRSAFTDSGVTESGMLDTIISLASQQTV